MVNVDDKETSSIEKNMDELVRSIIKIDDKENEINADGLGRIIINKNNNNNTGGLSRADKIYYFF